MLLAHFAGEGIEKRCGGASTSNGKDSTAIGSSGCGGPRVGFLEDDVILAQNAMTVLGDLPVKPPDDVLGVSLWDADDKPLWHRCFNCYSKAIVYNRGDALTLGTHVR